MAYTFLTKSFNHSKYIGPRGTSLVKVEPTSGGKSDVYFVKVDDGITEVQTNVYIGFGDSEVRATTDKKDKNGKRLFTTVSAVSDGPNGTLKVELSGPTSEKKTVYLKLTPTVPTGIVDMNRPTTEEEKKFFYPYIFATPKSLKKYHSP